MTALKLIYAPSVYLVGRQVIDPSGLDRFLADHGFGDWATDSTSDAETLVEVAARTCYMSFGTGRPHAEHIRHILEVGHGSCIEHAVWSMIVTGVSRSLTHELVRHRIGISPSQLSQRYVDESVAEYIVPPELHTEVKAAVKVFHDHWSNPQFDEGECDVLLDPSCYLTDAEHIGVSWINSIIVAHHTYCRTSDLLLVKRINQSYPQDGIKTIDDARNWMKFPADQDAREARTRFRKQAREAARSLLPNATETKIFLTGNARAWRNAIELRCSRHADAEIRRLFMKVWGVLVGEAPNLFGDYEKQELPDGSFELTTKYRKV